MVKENDSTTTEPAQQQGRIEIIYYTDPLCCWSWVMEQHWQKLISNFKNTITWRYCMGGLLPDWKKYNDHLNSVSRPAQMAPVWMHASKETGIAIYHQLWINDPPASSYPACIAVKCASLQSFEIGEKYLNFLREACMIYGRNIARYGTLVDIAEKLKKIFPHFDVQKFTDDMNNDNGLEAFRKDLQEVKYHNLNRFPTFITKAAGKAFAITGYRPYEHMEAFLKGL